MATSKSSSNSNKNDGTVYLILVPCHTSHEFVQRKIPVPKTEENAIKIGRAVGRILAATNNAIFDCKVLSRNHATVWGEGDKFYIKDTKSSNGTFINSNRLSNSGDESDPTPLATGDILQLGVEIVDNTKKVASGCIIAMVTFVDECGKKLIGKQPSKKEAQIINTMNERIPKHCLVIPEEQMFQLQHYITEATHRESALNQKLLLLEDALKSSKNATELNWEAMVNEDHLLDRVRSLEAKLKLCLNKNLTTEELKDEISMYFEQRKNVESIAKDLLKKSHQETSEVRQRLQEVEIALFNVEDNNSYLKKQLNDTQKEVSELKYELEKMSNDYDVVCQELEFTKATNQHLMLSNKNDEEMESKSFIPIKDNIENGIINNKVELDTNNEANSISTYSEKKKSEESDVVTLISNDDAILKQKKSSVEQPVVQKSENTVIDEITSNEETQQNINKNDENINDGNSPLYKKERSISPELRNRILPLKTIEIFNTNADNISEKIKLIETAEKAVCTSDLCDIIKDSISTGDFNERFVYGPSCNDNKSSRDQEEDLIGIIPIFIFIYMLSSLSGWTRSIFSSKKSTENSGK